MRLALLALAASMAFAACGKRSETPSTPTSVAAADLDAASPLDGPYRLKDGAELDVARLFELLPHYIRPTYESASFDPKLGATVVTNLTFGDVAGARGFAATRAEFYGVDLDRIEKLHSAGETQPTAPLEMIVRKLRLFDVESLGDASVRFTISAVEIDSLRARRGGIPRDPPGSGLAAFFNAFNVAGVYFKDIKANGVDAEASGTGAAFDFSGPDLRLVGLGGGRLKALLARDLDYLVRQSPDGIAAASRGLGPAGDILVNGPLRNFIVPENQRTKLKTLEWRDISFAGLMAYGLKGERPPVSARNLINLGTLRIMGAETFIGSKRFSIIPETTVSAMEFAWLAPSKLRAVTRGGLYDFTAYVDGAEEEAIAELKSRKLDKVKGDSDLAYDWSPDKGDVVLSTGFDSVGFADVDFDVSLEGLELIKIEAGRAAGAAQPVADLALLKSFSMVIADEKLLDAFYALSALESGGSAKDLRAATPAMMRLGKIELERDAPRLASYVDVIADFLEDGGTLEIRAEPETPVPLKAVGASAAGGPDAMADTINLTVTRKE